METSLENTVPAIPKFTCYSRLLKVAERASRVSSILESYSLAKGSLSKGSLSHLLIGFLALYDADDVFMAVLTPRLYHHT